MAAIFAAPVAAVLLAVELLLFEWKPRSFIPVAIASLTASVARVPLLGAGPIFPVVAHAPLNAAQIVIAFAVGITAGFASGLLSSTLCYFFEDLFPKIKLHWMWWPAIGGLFVGIGGLIDPRVPRSRLRGAARSAARRNHRHRPDRPAVRKGHCLVGRPGSGTSGGVLAPLLMMGGALGAMEAHWIPTGDTSLWAMICMAAMMGGTMRSPFTSAVFLLELTHDLNVLPGLLAGCIAAQAVTVLLLKRSILTEKVARRGHHMTREYSVDPLEVVRVSEIMEKKLYTVPAATPVSELLDRMIRGDLRRAGRQGAPLIDAQNRLVGIITLSDLMRALDTDPDHTVTALEAGSRELIVAYPDEVLREAVARMLRNDIGRLPVVSREDPHRLIGYLRRANLMAARQQRFEEEHLRERSWTFGKTDEGSERKSKDGQDGTDNDRHDEQLDKKSEASFPVAR